MKRARISGKHYFRIKILHQHRLTFLTGFQRQQPRSQQISRRNWVLQVLQCSLWVSENLLESWGSTLVSSPSELKQKTKELGFTEGFWLLAALPFHCASLYSFVFGASKMVKTTSFELASMPTWLNSALFKCLHLPKQIQMFFVKGFPIWV